MNYWKSPILEAAPGIIHGFFGLEGGVSEGSFSSLNCDLKRGDSPENVMENRRRVMTTLGFPEVPLMVMDQAHGNIVKTVTTPWSFENPPQADGMVTHLPLIALGVLTADCGPVLLADTKRSIIGACHAGWRGAFLGILEKTIEAMEALGSQRTDIIAALGPTIFQESYEVDTVFQQKFLSSNPKNSIFFQAAPQEHHFLFDLPGFIKNKLEKLCLKQIHILEKNTFVGPFFSRRKSLKNQDKVHGCGASVIMLSCLKK